MIQDFQQTTVASIGLLAQANTVDVCISVFASPANRVAVPPRPSPSNQKTTMASYGALGHVPLYFQQFIFSTALWSYKSMKAISHVKCLQDFKMSSAIRISSFLILVNKMKWVYRIFIVTRCISDACFVLLYACDLRYCDVVLCPSSRQILATPLASAAVAQPSRVYRSR